MNLAGPFSSGEVEGVCIDLDAADQDSNVPISGRVVAVYIEPLLSCLSSPTITISTKGDPIETILEVATDISGWYYPRTAIHLNTTGAAIANQYSKGVPIHDFVNVAISDALAGDSVNAWLLLE